MHMGWIERLVFFGIGVIVGSHRTPGSGPMIDIDRTGMRIGGFPIAVVQGEKIKVGGVLEIDNS